MRAFHHAVRFSVDFAREAPPPPSPPRSSCGCAFSPPRPSPNAAMAECADVVASLIKCIISTLASSADEGVDGPVNATNFDDRSAQVHDSTTRIACKRLP
eukprot:6201642-Pleurochrysis_carterae.AAC.4